MIQIERGEPAAAVAQHRRPGEVEPDVQADRQAEPDARRHHRQRVGRLGLGGRRREVGLDDGAAHLGPLRRQVVAADQARARRNRHGPARLEQGENFRRRPGPGMGNIRLFHSNASGTFSTSGIFISFHRYVIH